MRTLIILEGVAKTEKYAWMKREGLENYYVDINSIRRMFSYPDLFYNDLEILEKAYGDTVLSIYYKAIIYRMFKGGLIVTDPENESVKNLETLALIFGYTVFYVVQNVPQDYISKYKKYNLGYYGPKTNESLEKEIIHFLNQKFEDKFCINSYQDVIDYWDYNCNKNNYLVLPDDHKILHVSDLHSNYSLFKKLPDISKFNLKIFYGDYIDGPEKGGSKKLMDMILKGKQKNTIWLEGNHELRLRRFLGSIVYSEGNKEIRKILLENLPESFLNSTATEYSKFTELTARTYLEKMNATLKLFFTFDLGEDKFICTHSGIKFTEQLSPKYIGNVIYGGRNINYQDMEFNRCSTNFGAKSIHAHCKYHDNWNPVKYESVINLDPPTENEVIYAEQTLNNLNICQLQRE